MRDEIPMHDSVHWPVEDEVKPPSKKRYLVTAAVESIRPLAKVHVNP